MSWGYVPKKLKQARRQQRLRKKYKDFSCKTCWYSEDWSFCPKGYYRRGKWEQDSYPIKNCQYWKASTEAKLGTTSANTEKVVSTTEKKQPRKGLFSKLFK